MAGGSTVVVYAALVANFAIACAKFTAAAITGSSAMMSEGFHSVVDTGNQALILYGIHRAKKPPDEQHPFGHGQELYFWAFIVAILLFSLGGGLSIYEGVNKFLNPHEISNLTIAFSVLGFAIVVEAVAWYMAYREFKKRMKEGEGWFTALQASKDPAVFTVLLEDTAAMLGLFIATLGLAIGWLFDAPRVDGVASILIGVLLISTAVFLARETRSLLTGEAADPDVRRNIRSMIQDEARVVQINELLTMHFGPDDILVTASLDFRNGLDSAEVERTVAELEAAIREHEPAVKKIFIEAQHAGAHGNAASRAQ